MAAVARRLLLRPGVGERLLASKLQILSGTGNRRPSVALSILTGRLAEAPADPIAPVEHEPAYAPPLAIVSTPVRRRFAARTVYLSETHLHDIDRIIEAWQQVSPEPRRLTRSAVLRRAVEHLRAAVEADPAKFLENE
jgi:hypothetical protein